MTRSALNRKHIAAMRLMKEVSDELNENSKTKAIGNIYWGFMISAQEAYRTALHIRDSK